MSQAMTALGGNLQVSLIDTLDDIRGLAGGWLELERRSDQPCFFQSYAWCGHVAEVMTRTDPKSYVPLIAAATRDGALVAVWPLSRQKRSGIWQLRSLDDPFGQFSGLLADDADAATALVAATLKHLRERHLADALRFEFVVVGSPLEAALLACGAKHGRDVGAPVIDVRSWRTFEELRSSRNKKTMKNWRNARNRLAKAGEHEHRVAIGDARVSQIIASTLTRRGQWLEAKGLTAPQFRSAAHEEILGGGAAWSLDAQRVGYELLCDGRPLAHQWGFLHQRRYYAYMSAIDPDAIHLSPGRLHLAFVIAGAMRIGVDSIEMLTPASDYKMVWTDTARTLRDYAMPLSAAGWAHQILWERTVRPVMKAAFYALPAGLRRRAVSHDAAPAGNHEE